MRLSLLRSVTLLLNLAIALTNALPDCVDPPPPQVAIIQCCEETLEETVTVPHLRGNTPRIWDQNPPRIAGQTFLALFSVRNEFESVADVADLTDEVVFLTTKAVESG